MLAFPGSPVPLLAFVCMAPWLSSARHAAPLWASVSGFVLACLYSMPCTWDGMYTAAGSLDVGPARAALITFLFYTPYSLPFIVAGLYLPLSGGLSALRRAFGGSALCTASIYALPSLFPVTPGLMLHAYPWAIQLADVGGVPLVNFVLFLINFLIAGIAGVVWERRRPVREAACLLIVIALTAGYGLFRLAEFTHDPADPSARTAAVALVQPNLPRGVNEVGLIRDNRTQVLSALEMTRKLLKTRAFDLVVWPETSVPAPCSETGLVFRKLSVKVQELGISVLYQCLDCRDSTCFNAARMVLPDGSPQRLYYKRALIPFFETSPASGFYGLLTGLAPVKRDYKIGTEKIIFQTKQGLRVMPLICYDVHFPELLGEGDAGDLIAVLANDQIFGKSRIGYLDYAMNIFRAVEMRRPLVRVTNTGPSAIIQASGETVPGTLTPAYRPEARAATVYIPSGQTLYARCGDAFLYLMYCYLLVDMLFFIFSKRHKIKWP